MVINSSAQDFLKNNTTTFDLIFTSPPYNINKDYEKNLKIDDYLKTITDIILQSCQFLNETGSLFLQVGNTRVNNKTIPLDILFYNQLHNHLHYQQRIIWHFGHGLPQQNKFDNRYETILWFTKTNNYKFNLDNVRIPQKYPNYKKDGKFTCNPKGKNPTNFWQFESDTASDVIHNIPNVKAKHPECYYQNNKKHPCQFPVALAERIILSSTDTNDTVYDPFAGVASTGVAWLLHNRKFIGTELNTDYATMANQRLQDTENKILMFRPHQAKIHKATQPSS